MSEKKTIHQQRRLIPAYIKALKAARILKGLSRKEAGERCGISARAIEQLENARTSPSDARLDRILRAYRVSRKEFELLRADPDEALMRAKMAGPKARAIARKPRRSCFRVITKEVRVLRVLRIRKGLSQDEASIRCGYTRAILGQIENGRINIPLKRIEHIVGALGWTMSDFEQLMRSEVLRDEVISECSALLHRLDDQRLCSVRTIIISLGGEK